MSIYYLGAFPIEGGGVTNKNRDLFNALSDKGIVIKKVDLNLIKRRKNIIEIIKFVCALLPGNKYIIGVSGARGTSIKLIKFLNKTSHNNLKQSLYFMMGGTEAHRIAKNAELIKLFKNFKRVYVETASMKSALDGVGMENVDVFPNCRPKPNKSITKIVKHNESFKCVYFSYIEPMKGVDLILAVARMMPDVQFDFYGDISAEYKNTFLIEVNNNKNCHYYGYFNGDSAEIYKLLGQYDVLLFPTKWETEGVPGIIVEAKIAGLPVIASRSSYNSEIVEEDIDGILLSENTPEDLSKKITELLENPETLLRMKNACRYTAAKYYIEQYSGAISKILSGGGKLNCLFLSNVQREKGVDWLINVASSLVGLADIDIYGVVTEDYRREFFEGLEGKKNIRYLGVYTGSTQDLYKLMSKYDALLLPTRWENEGIPGVLIEAKMVGIPAIVTDHHYNKEVVTSFLDGIVLKQNTSEELAEAIKVCVYDRDLLIGLKRGCGFHSEQYNIFAYADKMVELLRCS